MSEAELAAQVVAFCESAGHDVYQEVEYRGAVIDIVSLVGPGREVWAIETKLRWSLELLTQCVDRKSMVHRVFAAVPHSRSDHSKLFAEVGVGSLIVWPGEAFGSRVTVASYPPRTTSRTKDWPRELRDRLGPGYKTHAKAGSPNGAGRWTPFRETCERVQDLVRMYPGITLKEAIDGMKHHYSSAKVARASIAHWIERKKIPGVQILREGKHLKLFPDPLPGLG